MPEAAIAELESALKAWGGVFESEIYRGAMHGWTYSDSAAYNPASADRAFDKLRSLLADTLG